jgi:hypothetical protein
MPSGTTMIVHAHRKEAGLGYRERRKGGYQARSCERSSATHVSARLDLAVVVLYDAYYATSGVPGSQGSAHLPSIVCRHTLLSFLSSIAFAGSRIVVWARVRGRSSYILDLFGPCPRRTR